MKHNTKKKVKDRWPVPSQGRHKRKAEERPKDEHPTRTKKRERTIPSW
jgi:hypothetical protein